MAKALLAYFSVHGHTQRISERIGRTLEQSGDRVELVSLREGAPDPDRYEKIIIGASIRNGQHNRLVHEFIRKHQAILDERPSAFFSVNLVARKPEKNTPETNPYVRKFIEENPWKPDLVGVFAGDLDYHKYGFLDRNIIRLIMWMTRGPTDPDTKKVFTDWQEVDRFARQLASLDGCRQARQDPGHS